MNINDCMSLLSDGARKWVASAGWKDFREIQKKTIKALLSSNEPHNVIVSAGTSEGKTEAAFLPALSIVQREIESNPSDTFCRMLYIAPLKALINDQYRRLCDMARYANIPVYLWHGDAPQGQKNKMLKQHDGIIMITPESLESFLMNRSEWCSSYMTPSVIVIDEFHAFIGNGRGKQMLSLLSRIDFICSTIGRRKPTRIGLSATLSKLDEVGRMLSPDDPVDIISSDSKTDDIDIKVVELDPPVQRQGKRNEKEDYIAIGKEIISKSLGEKTLAFARSRMQVEATAATINAICEKENIRSEAFPHHGSLSKETREALERRLVSTDKPTMAIATVTLELGIDIGDIYEVFQIGTTDSVASLRQRCGRSGRRNGSKRLESIITASARPQDMEEDLLITIAEIELMRAGWFEPPSIARKDVSVLVSEILSTITQYGSAREDELYMLLCGNGAFRNINKTLFSMVIFDMLNKSFIEETSDKQLLIGEAGEHEINDWHFYATFQTEETYTVKNGQKRIGEISPPDSALIALAKGGSFMLGGKYWKTVPPLDMKNKIINVKQTPSRAKFLVPTSKQRGGVNGVVKRTMINLLCGKASSYDPDYLDEHAREKLSEARLFATEHALNGLGVYLYDAGENGHETATETLTRLNKGYSDQAIITIAPPIDDPALTTLEKALSLAGMENGGFDAIPMWRMSELVDAVLLNWDEVSENKENLIDNAMLADIASSEKYNGILSDETLRMAYADEKIDLNGARKWLEAFRRFHSLLN